MGRSSRWSRPVGAGLIAVDVVDDPEQGLRAAQVIEIACACGLAIRLREDVSADVLKRALRVCQQLPGTEVAVRSC